MTFEPSCEGKEGVCYPTKRQHSVLGRKRVPRAYPVLESGRSEEWFYVEVTWGRMTGKKDQKDKLLY